MTSLYETNYNKFADYIRSKPVIYKMFKIIYKYIPYGTILAYGSLVLWCVLFNRNLWQTARVVLVPLTGFVIVSLMRKIFNFERPYTKYNIKPLITKNKSGESFPSRHTFSIGIIGMAFLYVNVPLGIIMLFLMVILAISRVVAGVHFVKDVIGAIIMAVLWGLIGFFII
ncbi:MAG: phosphatase PAP2 family protein [Lachnospira sp.]|nr:phosphatase PAP2 family protein [Lachnospira sp.]